MFFSDIPDNSFLKQFVGIGRHLWRTVKNLGYEYWQVGISALKQQSAIYDFLKNRVGNSIDTMQAIMGKGDGIKDQDKIHCYFMYPPTVICKSDLLQGTNKLIFGNSVDQSFLCIDDEAEGGEILFIENTHTEEGIPVDWWMVGPDDELLDRRHLKYGYKLREFPKKFKNDLYKMGPAAIDILKDVRNERTPQFSSSPYSVIMINMSGVINSIVEISVYEEIVEIWDYINAKKFYKTNNDWGAYIPMPSLLRTFLMLDRSSFGIKMSSLLTRNNLVCQGLEDYIYNWIGTELPEFLNTNFNEHWTDIGVPLPSHTLNCDLKSAQKRIYSEDQKFCFKYPKEETFFTIDDLNIDLETARTGVFLDVDHHSPMEMKINHSNVISTGLGLETRILK